MNRTHLILAIASALIVSAGASAEPLRVDLSDTGRDVEPGWLDWNAGARLGDVELSRNFATSFGDITIVFPDTDTRFRSQVAETVPLHDLLDDCFKQSDVLVMQIEGLDPGLYAVTTYHHDAIGNQGDNDGTFNVIVEDARGSKVIAEQLPQSWGPEPESVVSVTFTVVSNGGTVVVTFDQNQGSNINEPTWDEVFLNGFIMDIGTPAENARNPNPADEATDVPQDTILSWTPGEYEPAANGHIVYFSENVEDVNKSVGGIPQDANSYAPPQRLDYSKTYYWRVDEVNAPPDNTIFKGDVWSFTTEPIGYPVENITVTASSEVRADEGPQNTINGSGLDDDGLHSAENTDMWLSNVADADGTWIRHEFDREYKLYQMLVWNYNSSVEPVVGFGIKEAAIEYSTDGVNWTTLGDTHEFARGIGAAGYAANTTIDLAGVAAKYVKITANSNWGGIVKQYGLSEVRFLSIPVLAREPNPASGATDTNVDVTLSWRPGREAATHDVYLSTDEQAVIDGTAPVVTVTEASYPSSLDVAGDYYWRIAEVNDAETPATWQGDVWNFSTQEYIVVDDFESYNDTPAGEDGSNLVYLAWIDGFDNPSANGSTMGYVTGSSLESDNVHDGRKSVPLAYNNTAAGLSEVVRTFTPAQDWSAHGIETLSLWFAGNGANVPAQLYVKVNGVQVNYASDAANLAVTGWQTWNIDLAAINTNLSNVTSMTIGIQGPGATGTLLLDDVRLYSYDRQLITPTEPGAAGLQVHYEFEGNTNDSSGNARHGTAAGNPIFGEGKIGQAIGLDGLGDYVNIDGYKGVLGSSAITVSAWIKTNSTDTGAIVGWGAGVSGQRFGFRVDAGRLRLEHHGGNVQGDTSVNDGAWHHVAVTVRENATISYPEVILWLDGIDDTRAGTDPDAFNLTADQDVRIGSRPAGNDRLFIGQIDDVRIYDRALTQEQINWLAGRRQPFDEPF